MEKYYVYVHRDKQGNTFYVGKGCDKRAYAQNGRSSKWIEQADGGYWVEVIAQDLDESTALLIEMSLIKALNPDLTNSVQISEVVDPSRYLLKKIEQNTLQIEKTNKKISKLKKQLHKLKLTNKENEFINSNLALSPAKLLSEEDLSFRNRIASKIKKRKAIQNKIGDLYQLKQHPI